jgi:hypothetical protein
LKGTSVWQLLAARVAQRMAKSGSADQHKSVFLADVNALKLHHNLQCSNQVEALNKELNATARQQGACQRCRSPAPYCPPA